VELLGAERLTAQRLQRARHAQLHMVTSCVVHQLLISLKT
jgi:hypothetical protein